ncbi:MAG: AgmX/PglI C-terminal domain-containing protein [Polyangiaceae bacterium]|nr:AgmX/PglI C-terminal domain-containing protein [Polyangiaceae bacterium]MCW5789784.1 AgmX/PglI C-terminal domain-containing protein [Polyangiaceae bacterium]
MAQASAKTQLALRTAAVWGTSVVAVRDLQRGQSFELGDRAPAALPKPDGLTIVDAPVRAVAGGWELDCRGVTGGSIWLRGREEDPARLGQTGAPVPIVSGDYGLLQYGSFAIFFQFTEQSRVPPTGLRVPWLLLLAFILATLTVVGFLVLAWWLATPPAVPKPLELTERRELVLRFNLKEDPVEEEPPQVSAEQGDEAGSGVKDPGAQDKKPAGGGKKIAGAEGRLGKQGEGAETRVPGDPAAGLGGMSEVLSSEVGAEVQRTLGAISSVSAALGGLGSKDIVLGQGPGLGLKGGGPGGGGDGPGGVPFGAGTLDTGWGPGRGGGYGSGTGGPGGAGKGGPGKGGSGDGTGTGTGTGRGGGERGVEGAGGAKRAGQGLTPQQIASVVNSRYGAFRACYDSALARNPTLSGGVSASFTITPGGSVSSASVGGSSLGDPRVDSCILRQVRRLSFPAADKPTGANWSWSFRPTAAKKK